MGFIPIINKDSKDIAEYISQKISDPTSQRTIILVIVSVALLLDNMLYMVIVPIIPDYLRFIHAIGSWRMSCHDNVIEASKANPTLSPLPTPEVIPEGKNPNSTCRHYNQTWSTSDEDSAQIGILFASKAILQLFCNPISGTIIDRIGYDIPMLIGLTVIFLSTTVFAFGRSYTVMFIARSLQGLGSAFADTSGLAMIADRFTVESERSKALGIALAFISFGSLVAPPFGGILYEVGGKVVPFIMLASIALLDGIVVVTVMRPTRLARLQKSKSIDGTETTKGTPIHRLLIDPYVAICAGALAMSNVSLAFLEPTIADWMDQTMSASSWEKGLVWLPAFLPHVAGVYTTVKLARLYPQYQWLMAAIGLALEGVSCLLIPFCRNFVALMVPISIVCYGIALVDTALLPTMGFIVDTRHVSVYGSVYAIADIAYSLAYAFGPVMAGGLVQSIGFLGMNISIFLSNVLYAPILYFLRFTYSYNNLPVDENTGETNFDNNAEPKETVGLVESNHSPATYRSYAMNGTQGEEKTDPLISNSMGQAHLTDGYSYEGGDNPKFEILPGPPPEYKSVTSSGIRDRPQVHYQAGHPPVPPTQHHQPQPRSQWNPEVDDPTIRPQLQHQQSNDGARGQRAPTGGTGKDRTVTQIRKDDYGY